MSRLLSLCLLAAVCLFAFGSALELAAPVLTEELAERINSIPNLPWKASHSNGRTVTGASLQQIKALMGVKKHLKNPLPPKIFSAAELAMTLPTSFDAATQWPDCPTIQHIRDQSACGSCWAVAAAESMSDRYCTGGKHANLEISAVNILSCCWYCGSGCSGGDPNSAWSFWTTTGLLSDACQPYPFPKCDHHTTKGPYPPCPSATYNTPACSNACSGAGNTTLYKGSSSYSLSGEASFMAELYKNGPFEVAFDVYEDFLAYSGGVYVQTSSQYLGGHAVRLVGWGELNGVKYWKIANSWNADWGLNGYFLIRRGTDECGIEDSGSAGLA
jgi:cysteine peptidase C